MKKYLSVKALLMLFLLPSPLFAQSVNLPDFLSSVDKTEVLFEGRIKYDKSALNDIDFTYYNEQGEPFPVTIDAGRKVRERIQAECENSSFMASLKDLCKIKGSGTVEIRGSRIYLSVDAMTSLSK